MTGVLWPGKSTLQRGALASSFCGNPFSVDTEVPKGPRQVSQPSAADNCRDRATTPENKAATEKAFMTERRFRRESNLAVLPQTGKPNDTGTYQMLN